jgi:hypothetical protein
VLSSVLDEREHDGGTSAAEPFNIQCLHLHGFVAAPSAVRRDRHGFLSAAGAVFLPAYLFDFDAFNFALALDDFNPAKHQPQPPGYPLFVGVAKVINLAVRDARLALFMAGLVGATVSTLLVWALGEQIFGRRAGFFAAMLLMLNPVLLIALLTSPVRVYFAVVGCSIALLAWPGWRGRMSARRWYLLCFALGLLPGFRQCTLLFLLPLILAAGFRSRLPFRSFLVGGICLLAGASVWLPITAIKSGGFLQYFRILENYLAVQSQGSSMLYGAKAEDAWEMAKKAIGWSGLSADLGSPDCEMERNSR